MRISVLPFAQRVNETRRAFSSDRRAGSILLMASKLLVLANRFHSYFRKRFEYDEIAKLLGFPSIESNSRFESYGTGTIQIKSF